MSTSTTVEIATAFGGIDDTAVPDGGSVHAHLLRTLAKQANRLITRGHPLWTRVFGVSVEIDDVEAPGRALGDLRLAAPTGWIPISRAKAVPRKPGLRSVSYDVIWKIPNTGDTFLLQVCTRACPFRRTAADGDLNVLKIVGPGDSDPHLSSLTGVPGDAPALDETVQIFIAGIPTTRNMNTVRYGSPNTGTVNFAHGPYIRNTGATWNWLYSTSTPAMGGHFVELVNSDGDPISPPHTIVGGFDLETLIVSPAIPAWDEMRYIGASFRIRELPKLYIVSDAVYAETRTS